MKDAVILVLCAVALAQGFNPNPEQRSRPCNCDPSEAQQICQANYDSDDVLIAHENCNKFYKCAHGKPVAYYCPNNLLYDPLSETCEWPHTVDCGDRPISEGPGPGEGNDSDDVSDVDNDWTCNCNPGEAPSICAAEGSNGILVAHQNCNQFYKCAEGRPVTFNCPPTLLYNPYKEECDWPQNVECGDRLIPGPNEDVSSDDNDSKENDGTCNCNPEEAPAICAAPGSESVLIAHEHCNKYYICNHGIPVAVSCFGDLQFNPYTKQCDWPRNVHCGDRLVPETECPGCNDNEDTSCDDDDVPPPPGNESKPEDSESSDILPPGDDVVVSTQGPGTCNCNPEEAPSICAAANSSGILVAHENCNQFYKCDHGKPIVLSCHGDLLYNPYTEKCDWPENVVCEDRVIPTPDNSVSTPGVTIPAGTTPGDSAPGNNCNPSEAPAICAADDSDGVLVAHENCNQFYICLGGRPVPLICPPNLLFNPANDQCDWPHNVDCGDRVTPSPDDSASTPGVTIPGVTNPPGTTPGDSTPGNNCDPSEAPAICAADDSEGILVAHENCNQFYICNGGKPVALTCPPNLLFNPAKDECDWPFNVDCGDRVIPDPDDSVSTPGVTVPGVTNPAGTTPGGSAPGNNCDPSEAPAICAAEDSEGILVAHENCNQFYICNGGKPVALTCPPNLLFNPAKDQCDWPFNVDCGDRIIPDPISSESDSSEIRPPSDDIVVPTRPPGTCNCNPEEAPSICATTNSSGILVAHENCNQFYKCDHGKPVALTCHGDLLYNPYTEQCDWPENVVCGDRVIPDPDNSVSTPGVTIPGVTNPAGTTPGGSAPGNNCDPSEAPAICAAEDSEGVLVAHENCNQFYICNGGRPVVLTCPPNLLFNPAKDQCDWPFNVDCGDRVIPDPDDSVSTPGVTIPGVTNPPGTTPGGSAPGNNCDPSEAPAICAADDSEGILVAHENCNQFYICNGGRPVVLTCPPNLLFNPAKDQCDWPFNVDCGDRVIPDPDDSVSTPGVTIPGVTNPPGTTPGGSAPGNNCDPSEAPAICAADDSEGILVAHENCNQFYICNGGRPVVLTCPPNLLFNPAKDQCDWPFNVDCGDRVIPGPDDSASTPGVTIPGVTNPAGTTPGGSAPGNNCDPSEAPAICAAEDSEGVLVAHENCNQFYICNGGRPVVLTCPPNLLFNPAKDQCDWPFNVDCGDRVIPDPDDSVSTPGVTIPGVTNPPGTTPGGSAPGNNCDPSEAPAICAADDSEGILVAHENCNQFYICNGGRPVVLTCPPNLLFNPAKDQCDWPFNVDCGDRVIPGPDDSASTPGVTIPGVTNPAGTTPGGSAPGNNCDPSEAPAICAAEDSEGILVAHENCNQFYICNGGRPVVLTCPPNLLFNPAKDQCDWPFNVDCGDRVIPGPDDSASTPGVTIPGVTNPTGTTQGGSAPGNNCDPSEAPAICAAEDSEGILVAHENCNQFYICNGGRPVVLTCPPNLLFNPAKDQCDWPFNVDCGDRVIPGPDDSASTPGVTIPGVTNPAGTTPGGSAPGNNCDPSEAPAICAAEDSEGVLVAHENCNQFYICNGGRPVVLTCPPNLLFNPAKDQCDWPFNVDCGDRVIPGPDDSASTPGVTIPGVTNPPGTTPGGSAPGNNCDPSEAPAICAADDSEGILVAHENCNQFYICNGGRPVVLTCPPNLLFNPAKDQCDWPFNVDCGDRVIPGPDDSASTPGVTIPGVTNPAGTTPGGSVPGNNCDPSEAPAICAAENSEGVLVAHQNCNQFYICNGGKPVALTCPPNLLFNPAKDQCDWPFNVDCGDRVIPDPESSDSDSFEIRPPGDDIVVPTRPPGTCNCNPEEAPSICATTNSSGILIAHENCNQFYKCDHGKPVALTCHGDLLYNPYTEQCDWPENVVCGDRVVPDQDNSVSTPGVTIPGVTNPAGTTPGGSAPGNNCDPSEAPAICAADDSEGILVAHENCNQFYICNGGKPVVLSCPPNLLFNPAKDQCDWPFNVDCGDRVISGPDDSVSTPGVTIPGVTNPAGTTPGVSAPGNNCDPSEAPAICAADDSEGILVAHENCNQFYICNGGKPVVLSCPPNLLFNPAKDECDWPFNVECGDRVIPGPDDSASTPGVTIPGVTNPAGTTPGGSAPGNNCDPSEAPAICAADNSDGILVAHENCNQFYICFGGIPVALTCPQNLLFNTEIDQCDWPFNVNCGDRVIPDTDDNVPTPGVTIPAGTTPGDSAPGNNCDPSEAPAICAADNSEGVLVAHENCNQFYKCSGGKPVALSCPPKLLFNPTKDQCDWPQNVDCGDRVIQVPEDSDSDSAELRPPGDDVVVPTLPPAQDSNETTDCSEISDEKGDQCNCNPEQAPSICAVNNSDGVLIAHENCNQFYKCDNGNPVPFRCPSNTFYDPVNQTCDWSFNVDCGDRIIPDPEDNVSESKEVDSEEKDIVGPCNCNPEEAPAICAAEGSSGVQIAHENCNQFYMCDHGRPVAFTCHGLLLYNPYNEQCDWPPNVVCGDRLIPEPESDSEENIGGPGDNNGNGGNDDPSQAPTICAGYGADGVLVAHENCDQYYICAGGIPLSQPCNPGLLFNPSNQQCDWPRNVNCGDRIIPDDCACNPRNAPALCSKPGSEGKLIAHENCNQFYICSHSVPVAQTCPAGLFYNYEREWCDWSQNVNCGDRLRSNSLNKHYQSRQTFRK